MGRICSKAAFILFKNWNVGAVAGITSLENYGFNRPILAGCARVTVAKQCQRQRVTPVPGSTISGLAIGCENCHGPGQQHVREMTTGKGKTVRTGRASIVTQLGCHPRFADNICMFCHQTGDVRVLKPIKATEIFIQVDLLTTRYRSSWCRRSVNLSCVGHLEHYYSMTLSKCYRSSGRWTQLHNFVTTLTCSLPARKLPHTSRRSALACQHGQKLQTAAERTTAAEASERLCGLPYAETRRGRNLALQRDEPPHFGPA